MVHAFSKNTLSMYVITFVGGLLADSSPFLEFNSRLYVNKTVVLVQLFKMAWLCVAVSTRLRHICSGYDPLCTDAAR